MERHNRLSRLRRAKELSKVVPVIKGEPIIIKGEPGERGEPGDPGKDADVEKVKDELIQDISPLIPSTKKVVEKVLSQIKVPRGERGLPGQRGERGAQGAQGSKGLNWQGQWKIDNDYSLDDGVYNDGSAFICVKAHISSKINEPVAGMNWKEFWNVMAEQGVQGAGGKAGTPGANGVGVPTGGTTNQVLKKASNADYDTTWGAASGGGSWGSIAGTLSDQTDLQTALDAKQASDADLTAIAGLDSSTSGAIASDGAGWIKKTYAQFKTALSLVKGDVGLGSVDNTADSAKNVLSATKLTTARNIDGQSFDGSADITVIAPGTHAATSKTTPVDADELPLVDSAAANVLKKLTWANLKATIKAYTDTLYPSGSGTSSGSNTGDQTISDATISTTDITTNDVSTSKHGFAPKAVAPASGNLNVYGIANAETAIANKLLLDTTTPSTQAYGDAAAAGTSLKAARVDHKHAMPASTKDTTAQTGLLKGDGSAISAVTAPAGTVVGTSDSQTLTNKDLSSATNTFPTFDKTNYALNGNMQFWQRNLTPTTLFDPIYKGTTLSTTVDAYGPDQFKIAEENAKVQVNQTDTNGSAESGLSSRYYANFKKFTNTGKMMIYQPIEGVVTQGICNAGNTMTLQVAMKASSSKTIRLGVLQLNSSGTIDSIASAIVPSTFGANSTDPTLATNTAYVTAGLAIPSGAQGIVSGNGANCSVTTSWQTFAINFTPPANAKNLILAIWTDSQFSANDILSLSQVMLTNGAFLKTWAPFDPSLRLVECQRFLRVLPLSINTGLGFKVSSARIDLLFSWSVPTRATGTFVTTITDYGSGTTKITISDFTAGNTDYVATGAVTVTGNYGTASAVTMTCTAATSFDHSTGDLSAVDAVGSGVISYMDAGL